MSIQFKENKTSYISDGIETNVSFNFKVFDEQDLRVIKVFNNVITELNFSTDFTVNLNDGEGGSIDLAVAAENTAEIYILRASPIEQDLEIDEDFVNLLQLENKLDYIVTTIQDQNEISSRAIKVDVTNGNFNTDLPTDLVDGDMLKVNPDGDGFIKGPNAVDVDGYGASIATNTSDIATNTTAIGVNTAAIATKAEATELAAKANTADLATVATSGDYDDLSNLPTVPVNFDDLADVDLTGATLGQVPTLDGFGNWVPATPSGGGGGAVDSVNGEIGIVVLDKDDVGLGNVDNTSDANKPVSTAQQTALNLKANSADLATVATSGDYDDLINTPVADDSPLNFQSNFRTFNQSNTITMQADDGYVQHDAASLDAIVLLDPTLYEGRIFYVGASSATATTVTDSDGSVAFVDKPLFRDAASSKDVYAYYSNGIDWRQLHKKDLRDGEVDTAQLADDAVTTAKIADDAVTSDKINDDAKVKYSTKFVPATTSVNANDIAALRFDTNVVIGKVYQVIIFLNCKVLNARASMRCNHDGTEVGIIRYTNEENANEFFIGSMTSDPFVATTTSVTTDIFFTNNSGGSSEIFGGANSRVTLLERNDMIEAVL